jgi:hypothetical protein
MSEYSEEHIKNILNQYQRKREKEKERYERIKDTEEFKTQNRQRARNHYQVNKDKKKEKYDTNKEFMNARSSYYYYKKKEQLDLFKEKYPNKVNILMENNIII